MWISKFKNANYKGFLTKLKEIAQKEGKVYLFLIIDYLFLLIFRGFAFNDYLNYELYNKNFKERRQYVSVKDQDKFYEIVSPSKYKNKFSNKSNFMRLFKDFTKRDFFDKKNSIDDLVKFLNKHDEIIIKPVDGLGGANISKIKTKNVKNIDLFYNDVVKNNYLVEEVIKQHKSLAEFSKSSINTIRIMTSNINNKPKVIFATLRVGNGKSHVDNFHQGGMASLVNIETGIITSDAVDKNLTKYKYHPLSKKAFKGYKIPYFKETKELVLKAAKVVPEIKVVGWDIAITPNGPTIVEGNRRAGFDIIQVVSGTGRKDIIKEILKELSK
ncbi:MAG TPA: sugar-transfer associated ATP-grasp domain-containing protein [Bacilli bacterium]|nr:sugar-transfer associated ATP-grasp domain-containing protein [Bacilli bacterium]